MTKVSVSIDVYNSSSGHKFVICWPWGPETCYTGAGLKAHLVNAGPRITRWMAQREPFKIAGWDLT